MKDFTNSEKIFDAHIHIGQFYNQYTSPTKLRTFLDSVGINRFAASSTTICEGKCDKVIEEMSELQQLCEKRFLPVLWILPQMLNDGGLKLFINSGIQWCCLKIHPQLHPEAWLPDKNELEMVLSLADKLDVPLLIHTGEREGCYPSLYEKAFANNPNIAFILAHGRPLDEAIEMMKKYPNVWVDTAFMPTDNIKKLCDENLSDRVLWGSDYPIPKYYYPDKDMKDYYLILIQQLKETIKSEDFEKITYTNFKNLFG